MTEVAELVARLVAAEELTAVTLSRPRRAEPSGPMRVTVEPVTVRGELRYRWRTHFRTRTVDENLTPEDATARVAAALGGEYRQGLLHAPDADWQVLAGGRSARVLRRPPTRPEASRAHDRARRRLLPEGEPVPFLVELGVMTPEGAVRASRRDKHRQVSRFLELVADVLPALPGEGTLRVVDFGSGKSYLTFAVHHLLAEAHGREVDILGLDLKEDVVRDCEALARRLGARGLRFEVGDIATHPGVGEPHLVVSLHACDTATDAALDRAVRAGARVILAVPCCHHEVAGQIRSEALAPLLAHGALLQRVAADATDAARARLLELAGYDVQVVELVPLEHTPKNLLLRATRRARPRRPADRERLAAGYRAFADGLGIEPALERLLRDRIPAG